MDCSPPGSFVHGILQARILEWAAISLLQGIFLTQGSSLCLLCLFYWQVGTLPPVLPGKPRKRAPCKCGSWRITPIEAVSLIVSTGLYKNKKRKGKSLSRVRLFATPWTVPYQAPPSMGFSWQRYWSGLPFPSPEYIPGTGIEPRSTCIHQLGLLPKVGTYHGLESSSQPL